MLQARVRVEPSIFARPVSEPQQPWLPDMDYRQRRHPAHSHRRLHELRSGSRSDGPGSRQGQGPTVAQLMDGSGIPRPRIEAIELRGTMTDAGRHDI